MLPPMLRIRFWRLVALPICSLRKRADRQRGQRHEDAAGAEAGDHICRDDAADRHLQAQPAQKKAGQPHRREAESGQQARINPAHQRADKKQRDKRADSARADA